MSLITVKGVNPFAGQRDPWVGMDSTLSYEDNGDEIISNSYTLEGVLSGCSYDALTTLRNGLARSFDWKADPLITGQIIIKGLDVAGPGHALVPRSISFGSSNYVGTIPYTIQIESFTGYDYGEKEGTDNLIDKTHTVSTSIDEKGCSSTTTNISCTPNGSFTGSCAVDAANTWITNQLGVAKLGAVTVSRSQPLKNESLTINPLTSAVSYTSTAGANCDNTINSNAPDTGSGSGDFQLAYCTESTTENSQCSAAYQIVKVKHNGEIYGSGKSQSELLTKLNSSYLNSFAGISDFGGTYNALGDSLTFNFTTHLDGAGGVIDMPKDLLLNNYSYNISTTYGTEPDEKDMSNGSIGGSIIIENRIKKSKSEVLDYDSSAMKDIIKGKVGESARLTSSSVTKDKIAGTHSYSFAYSQTPDNPDETPSLDGYSGVTNYSINYTPALNQYETVPNLNCDDLIFDKQFNSEGSTSISLSATSGSGYDFETNGKDLFDDLKNQIIKDQTNLTITKDEKKLANDGKSATWNYAASFTADSAIDENTITSMQ